MEYNIEKTCCLTGHRPQKCKVSEADIRTHLYKEIQAAINDSNLSQNGV